MTEWKEYKLEEIIEVFIDYRGKTPQKSSFGIPLITAKVVKEGRILPPNEFIPEADYDSWMTRGLPEINDVVLTTEAPLGEVALIKDNRVALAQRIITMRGKRDIVDNIFLKYYFQSKQGQYELSSRASGTTVFGIKAEVLKKVPVFLPPLIEQRRIAAILSSLDDKIDLLHRENATLEQMAETLFRQWFVEDAKEEWEEGKLGNYVDETIGGEWGKENPEGDYTKAVQCIRGTDIANLNVGLADKTPIRFVKESKFEKIEPRNGDIIMEISGGTESQSTGRVAYINEDVKTLFQYPIVFSNFCRLLRVDEKYSYFLYCYLKYLYDQDEYFNLENGSSGIKNLDYKALLYDLTYPMPKDKRLIFEFNDNVSLHFKKINRNKQQIQTLTQTRDGLLPKLMNNEIIIKV